MLTRLTRSQIESMVHDQHSRAPGTSAFGEAARVFGKPTSSTPRWA